MAGQLNERRSGSSTSNSESASCRRDDRSSLSSGIRPRSFCASPMTSFSAVGPGSSLALISGASARLDAAKMMSLQGDARSRHISGEIMKRHLYESVITTTRPQRLSVGSHTNCGQSLRSFPNSNSFHSMPVTPFRGSQEVSPVLTPPGGGTSGSAGGFFRFFSRGATPKCTTPAEEDLEEKAAADVGLALLIGVRSRRHGSISRCNLAERMDANGASEDGNCVPP